VKRPGYYAHIILLIVDLFHLYTEINNTDKDELIISPRRRVLETLYLVWPQNCSFSAQKE
jgi:hypothetical protein